jgi:hypothetical protein
MRGADRSRIDGILFAGFALKAPPRHTTSSPAEALQRPHIRGFSCFDGRGQVRLAY